jgi:ribonuclease HI
MAQFYGVWVGKIPGIYSDWNQCKEQIDKFPKALYSKLKSTTLVEAKIEFNAGYANKKINKEVNSTEVKLVGPQDGFLTVDGAANGVNCEFQAVWYPDGKLAFASKVFDGGTNNIAEFLGLVLACRYLKNKGLPIKVYTDSVTAMAWVRNKKANTTANKTGKATEELDNLIEKAEQFLKDNSELMSNAIILKWETKEWGEIPADYGRK